MPSEQVGLSYITKKYKLPLQVTISEVAGMDNCDVRFILPEDVPAKKTVSSGNSHTAQDIRCEEAHLNPKYTFDTFIVGSNNKFAQAAALAVAESPGEAYNPLFHLRRCRTWKDPSDAFYCPLYIEQNPEKVRYFTLPVKTFTNELIETIRKRK